MHKTNHIHIPFIALALLLTLISCSTHITADYPRCQRIAATVSSDSAWEDVIEIPFDEQGANVKLQLTYSEQNGQLKATLKSDRPFLAFAQSHKSSTIFSCCRRKLKPQNMNYGVLVPPMSEIRLSEKVYKRWQKPRKQHMLGRLIHADSTLLLADSLLVRPLLQDSVTTTLLMPSDVDKATITLRNIYFLQPHATATSFPQRLFKSHKKRLDIVADNDLNRKYEITIHRNPCFGTQAQQEELQQKVQEVEQAYKRLISKTTGLKVYSKDAKEVFEQHRIFLESQYPHLNLKSACNQVQTLCDNYNLYADSIAIVECVYIPPMEETSAGRSILALSLPPQLLQMAARQIDQAMARYLISTDPVERHDLLWQMRTIINNTNAKIQQSGIHTPEQRQAKLLYDKSVSYARTYSNL